MLALICVCESGWVEISQQHFYILFSNVKDPWIMYLVLWFRVIVGAAAAVSHFASPLVRVQSPVTEGDKTDQLYLRKRESSRCERDISLSSADWKHVTHLERWPLIISQPTPHNVNIHFLHLVQLQRESANVQRDREGSQAPCSSNLFHVIFPLLSRSLKSSTFVSTSHPQHPSFLVRPPFISFPLPLTLCRERRCMIYEALFLPVTEEKERREAVTKRERERRGRRIEGRVWRASPRGRRTGECEGDIHHSATPWLKMKTGSRLIRLQLVIQFGD